MPSSDTVSMMPSRCQKMRQQLGGCFMPDKALRVWGTSDDYAAPVEQRCDPAFRDRLPPDDLGKGVEGRIERQTIDDAAIRSPHGYVHRDQGLITYKALIEN